jgi:ribosomal protein S18 acetylase RimI-like enzyme
MQVAADNVAARHFYSRQGFAEKKGYGLWIAPLDSAGGD